jgi:hypothetical protein
MSHAIAIVPAAPSTAMPYAAASVMGSVLPSAAMPSTITSRSPVPVQILVLLEGCDAS